MSQPYNSRFLEFMKSFALIGKDSRLFPKKCVTCGKEYRSFPEFIHDTSPVRHCLEDCRDVSDALATLQYRNCPCGSTLVLILTRDIYPMLDVFWEMMEKEAAERNKPLPEVVSEFREQCNRFILEHQAQSG